MELLQALGMRCKVSGGAGEGIRTLDPLLGKQNHAESTQPALSKYESVVVVTQLVDS